MQLNYNRSAGWPRVSGSDMRGRGGAKYFPGEDLIAAANVALACEMPLLLTGDPGCGKTDFAFAIAHEFKRGGKSDNHHELLQCYVRSDSRARDLLYHYDAVGRFSDAQHGSEHARDRAADARHYIRLQPLARGLLSSYRRVVLIDEIDKAQRDVPNDLLRPIEQRAFDIPEASLAEKVDAVTTIEDNGIAIRETMAPPREAESPFIVITSNVERQLPEPFLRRCVFFHIEPPSPARLRSILEDRFVDSTNPELRSDIVTVFNRLQDVPGLSKKPTTSELIDWTTAITTVFDATTARERLESFVRTMESQPTSEASSLPWSSLPGVACLLKLREDLARLHLVTS